MNRRQFLSRSLTGGAVALVSPWEALGGVASADVLRFNRDTEEIVLERAMFVMGTVVRITVYSRSEQQALVATSKAFGEISRLDRLLSLYRPESDISRINRDAGDNAPVIDSEVLHLLEIAVRLSAVTDGAHDITIEPLMRLWGFRENPRLDVPTDGEIIRALECVGLKNLILDRNLSTAGLTKRGACLDLGGIAVGYAVDRATEILKESGIQRGFINHSGDAYALGAPPDSDGWEVVVPHPLKPEESIASMRLRDRAISTSGNYERFVLLDGIRRGHILDPHTGLPGNGCMGMTVIAPCGITADALSTGFFCMSEERLAHTIRRTPDIESISVSRDSHGTLVRHLSSEPS